MKCPSAVFCKSKRGRTGFDLSLEAQAACRGWFVGLVKNRTKQINADHEDLALAA
jgi:beta-lactamase class D